MFQSVQGIYHFDLSWSKELFLYKRFLFYLLDQVCPIRGPVEGFVVVYVQYQWLPVHFVIILNLTFSMQCSSVPLCHVWIAHRQISMCPLRCKTHFYFSDFYSFCSNCTKLISSLWFHLAYWTEWLTFWPSSTFWLGIAVLEGLGLGSANLRILRIPEVLSINKVPFLKISAICCWLAFSFWDKHRDIPIHLR